MDKEAELRAIRLRVANLEQAIGDLYSHYNELAGKIGVAAKQPVKPAE